jgi:plastocyanin
MAARRKAETHTRASARTTHLLRRGLAAFSATLLAALLVPIAAFADGHATIEISDRLTPRDLTVAPGTTVTWVNADSERHRIRSTSGPVDIDSGNLDPGQSFQFTFEAEGTYLYADDRDRDNNSYHGTVIVSSTGGPGDPGDPPAPPPQTGDVRIVNDTYLPASITVNVGGTVTWINEDREHTVTATDRSWDSGIFDVGENFTRSFDTAGTYPYFCIIHPDMQGTVIVSDGGSAPPPPISPPTTAPPPPPTEPPPPGTDTINVIDNDFDPGTKTVSVGSTVRWTNQGALPHTVTLAGVFDSGIFMPGETYSRTFTTPGTYDYLCTLHQGMSGTLIVTDGSGGTPPPPPTTPTTQPPSPPPPVAAQAGDISMVDNDFSPSTRTVRVGTTVRWVNNGQLPHTASLGGVFDSGLVMPGETYTRQFDQAGTYNYRCTLHPGMNGTLVVTDAAGDAPVVEPAPVEQTQAGTSASGDAQNPSGKLVDMVDNAYEPVAIEVTAGEQVTWSNIGVLPHTVTARDESFDSGFVMPGEQWTTSFTEPGTFEYFCTIHPEMVGTLTVLTAESTLVGVNPDSDVSTTDAGEPFTASEAAAPIPVRPPPALFGPVGVLSFVLVLAVAAFGGLGLVLSDGRKSP